MPEGRVVLFQNSGPSNSQAAFLVPASGSLPIAPNPKFNTGGEEASAGIALESYLVLSTSGVGNLLGRIRYRPRLLHRGVVVLYYLVKHENPSGMAYVAAWGPAPESRMRFLRYDELPKRKELPAGTYIFSDLERLTELELQLAVDTWAQLSQGHVRVRLLNDPSDVPGRYDLLRLLHGSGENRYRVARLDESVGSIRFPVVLKYTNEHGPALPDLLNSPAELKAAVRYLKWRGRPVDNLFIAEFFDTSDTSGVFRKYSAFIVGDTILPRHLLFSRRWMVKRPDLAGAEFAAEEKRFLEQNPHEEWLRHVFSSAGVNYGRIDYGFLGDLPQVWEINTNPTIHSLAERLTSAFEEIDVAEEPAESIPVTWDSVLIRSIAAEERKHRRKAAVWKAAENLLSTRGCQKLIRLAREVRPNRWYQEARG